LTPRQHRGLLCQAGHPLVSKLLAGRGRDAKGEAALDKVGILDEGECLVTEGARFNAGFRKPPKVNGTLPLTATRQR
jgi:hypothetical protein